MTDNWELGDEWIDNIEYPVEEIDPYQYILGMDPGGTTGIAMLRIDTENEHAKPELIYLHQIEDGRYGFKEFFEGSAIVDSNLTVVSEKWRERNIKGANREPQYIEGGIHMLWGEENVEWQYPDVKDVITDDYLKSQNLWTPNHPHQMDALRHALAYLRNSGHSGTLDTMNPDGSGETIAQPGEAEGAQLSEQGKSEATPDAQPGEGEGAGEGEGRTFAQAMQAVIQDNQGLIADARTALAAIQTGEGQDGEGEGFSRVGGFEEEPDDGKKRSRRERNGAFAGFNPTDFEEGGTTLLDD